MYRFDMMAMAMGGGESMMMTESYAIESSTVDSRAIEEYQPHTLEQSAAAILAYVNWYIEQNHPNTEALYDIKAFLEDTLKELRKKGASGLCVGADGRPILKIHPKNR